MNTTSDLKTNPLQARTSLITFHRYYIGDSEKSSSLKGEMSLSIKISIYTPPQKKQKLSVKQTYFLAQNARGKLSNEAAKSDHDLRLLVGHASMLDSLMRDLADAEQAQRRWCNRSLSGARDDEKPEQEHVETIEEEPKADWEEEDTESSDGESESDEEEQLKSTTINITQDVDADMEKNDETYADLALTRTASRHSPSELTADSEPDSDEDHMQPPPPNPIIDALTETQRQAIATTSFYKSKEALISPAKSLEEEGLYLPSRLWPTIIAAY